MTSRAFSICVPTVTFPARHIGRVSQVRSLEPWLTLSAIAFLTTVLADESRDIGSGEWVTAAADRVVLAVAGVIYSEIFKKRSCDEYVRWMAFRSELRIFALG